MGDTVPANNEEFFVINRGVRWKVMACPICDAAYYQTYRELICHILYPPNCLNNINQRNQIPENDHIGPLVAPVLFPVRLTLMLLWPVIWLCYQVCYYTVAVPIMTTCNATAPILLFLGNLSQRYYSPARDAFSVSAIPTLPVAPAGGFLVGRLYQIYHCIIMVPAVYIYETAKACIQFMQNFPGQLYQNVDTAICAFVPLATGYFDSFYQNARGIGANTIVPFGWFILRALYSAFHYLLKVLYTYISKVIATTFQATVRAVYSIYQRIIRAPIIWIFAKYIEPLLAFARYIINAPRRVYQLRRHLIVVRFATIIDGFIGPKRAFVQRVFIWAEYLIRRIYEGIERLNSAMYNFVYFPVDISIGTASWMGFVYRAFFCIHIPLLVYICICCYIQVAIHFVSNAVYVK